MTCLHIFCARKTLVFIAQLCKGQLAVQFIIQRRMPPVLNVGRALSFSSLAVFCCLSELKLRNCSSAANVYTYICIYTYMRQSPLCNEHTLIKQIINPQLHAPQIKLKAARSCDLLSVSRWINSIIFEYPQSTSGSSYCSQSEHEHLHSSCIETSPMGVFHQLCTTLKFAHSVNTSSSQLKFWQQTVMHRSNLLSVLSETQLNFFDFLTFCNLQKKSVNMCISCDVFKEIVLCI